MPAASASHKWIGQGQPSWGSILAGRVADQGTLPPASCLRQSPSLEATCARALDLCDPHRIPVFFTLVIQCFSLPVEVRLCGSYLLWPTGRMTSRLLRTWGHIRQSCKVSLGAQRGRLFWRNLCFFRAVLQPSLLLWCKFPLTSGWGLGGLFLGNGCTTLWLLWLLALLWWICCVLLWIPKGFHLLLSQSSLSCQWKQRWDLGVDCGGFPQKSNVFWLLHSRTGQGSFLAQSLGRTLLVVKQIWVGLLMLPTVLLLILLQYGENFGL